MKKVPAFRNEDAERAFWASADSTEYVDWDRARIARFPKLRTRTTAISIRLPDALLADLKQLAHERDVPYQSLLKIFLADRVALERTRTIAARRIRR